MSQSVNFDYVVGSSGLGGKPNSNNAPIKQGALRANPGQSVVVVVKDASGVKIVPDVIDPGH